MADAHLVPAGTTISLKSVVRIDASLAGSADGFPAVITGSLPGSSGETLVHSGSPVRLVILATTPPQLGIAAIMVEGSWRAVAGSAGGAALGTLLRGVLDPNPIPQQRDESAAIRTAGADIHVPAGALLIYRTEEPMRFSGVSTDESAAAARASK
jgi:hypothetical protein